MCGKYLRLDPDQRELFRNQFEEVRDEYENENLGRFEKIYPVTDDTEMAKYETMIKYARNAYDARDNKLGYSPSKLKRNIAANHHSTPGKSPSKNRSNANTTPIREKINNFVER